MAKFTYHGHACFTVEIASKKLLFDPFVTPNPLAQGKVDVNQLEADYILVSHGHEDHVADLVSVAKRTGAPVLCNFEIYLWLTKQGVENVFPMNHGGKWKFDWGYVKMVNAVHSSILPDGTYGGNPGGFVVVTNEGSFYYSGDTAVTMDMQLIPKFAKIDFAVLPIGDVFTMDVEEAILAAKFVETGKVVGVHYDTFDPIKIDKQEAVKKFEEAGLELLLPAIGETIEL